MDDSLMIANPLAEGIVQQVVEELGAGIILLDERLHVVLWNRWIAERAAIPAAQARGQSLAGLLNLKTNSRLLEQIRQAVERGLSATLSNTLNPSPLPLYEKNACRESAQRIAQQLLIKALRDDSGRRYCLIQVHDVSDAVRRDMLLREQSAHLQRYAEQLARSELHTRSILNSSPDAIITFDRRGVIHSCNPAAIGMFNLSEESLLNLSLYHLLPQLPREMALDQALASMGLLTTCAMASRICMSAVRNGGEAFHLEIAVNKIETPEEAYYTAVCRDITKRRQTEERLQYLAQFDALTALANRTLFQERLKQALARCARDGGRVALLFIDLDRFKPVNDRWGHQVGDLLLKQVANRLHGCFRETDTVARLGGDEFAVVMSDAGNAAAIGAVCERVLQALAAPFEVNGQQFEIGSSIGIAISDGGALEEVDTLIAQADSAMYECKAQGGGGYRFFAAQ